MEHKHSSFLPLLHFLSGSQSSILLFIDEQGLIPLKCCLKDLGTRIGDFLPENRRNWQSPAEGPQVRALQKYTLQSHLESQDFLSHSPKLPTFPFQRKTLLTLPNEACKTRLPFKIPRHIMQKTSLLRFFMPMSTTLKSNFRNSRF